MKIEERILKILEERDSILKQELIDELKEHPGVVEYVLKKMLKEGKIKFERKYKDGSRLYAVYIKRA